MDLLKKTRVRDILPPSKGLVCLRHTDSVSEALKTLSQHGILSAPVLNEDGTVCLGSLDVLDLVAFVVSSVKHGPGWKEQTRERFRLPIFEALGASKENPFLPVLDEAFLSDVVTNLFQKGVHRVPVYDADASLYAILSQSDIAAFVWSKMADPNEKSLFELSSQTLGKLGIAPSLVISVFNNVSVMQSFDYIIANKISGLAVVDQHGKLIGNISASDFKGFNEDNFDQYLEMESGKFVSKQMLAVSCKQHTSLVAATSLFVNLHIHRVYVIDDEHRPIGVFAMTDLMKVLAR